MNYIYELQHDTDGIEHMQYASTHNPFGLKITHGLIGAAEWWSNIESGDLALRRVEGIVSAFWPGQGRSGPAEFQIQISMGDTSNWPCEIEPVEAKRQFRIGRHAAVEYVIQELKVALNGKTEVPVPLTIWLDEAQPFAPAEGQPR